MAVMAVIDEVGLATGRDVGGEAVEDVDIAVLLAGGVVV